MSGEKKNSPLKESQPEMMVPEAAAVPLFGEEGFLSALENGKARRERLERMAREKLGLNEKFLGRKQAAIKVPMIKSRKKSMMRLKKSKMRKKGKKPLLLKLPIWRLITDPLQRNFLKVNIMDPGEVSITRPFLLFWNSRLYYNASFDQCLARFSQMWISN